MRSPGAVVAAALLLSGCSGSSSDEVSPKSGGACGSDFLNRPAEVVSEPQVVEVSEDDANLVLDLSTSTREPVRVTVRLNGKVAIDVRTPAVPAQCGHAPVDSHEFRLPSASARVTVATDRGQRRSIIVPLDTPTHWVAVQPQDGLLIGLDAYNEEPAWG